jgi:hypothetical protein
VLTVFFLKKNRYSDSDPEEQTRKAAALPSWAQSPYLTDALRAQSSINPDLLFGAIQPLRMEGNERHYNYCFIIFFRQAESVGFTLGRNIQGQQVQFAVPCEEQLGELEWN